MFEREGFIEQCRAAVREKDGHKIVRELLQEVVSDPAAIEKELQTPERGFVEKIYVGPDLTIIHLGWPPKMVLRPHNHKMWANIGIYRGREDNMFWRELPPDSAEGIEAAGAKSIGEGDVAPLGKDIIHSVANPTNRLTCALHVYGGDFFEMERNEWDPDTLAKERYSMENTYRAFEEANRIFQ